MTSHLPASAAAENARITEPLSGHARNIVKALLLGGDRSRTDLVAELDLSAGSLTRLTKPLLSSGLIIELPAPEGPTGLGRPSVPLGFNHEVFRFVGIKLTKTHAYGALTRADSVMTHQADRTLVNQSPETALHAITAIVQELTANSDVATHAIGITLGGHVENYRTVTHADHLGWDQIRLAELVEEATGITTVVENDIVAQTEFTHWFGQGADAHSFALFTMGAGIGYGLVTNGQTVGSPEAGLSLLSHFPLFSSQLASYARQLDDATEQTPKNRGRLPLWPLTTSCDHLGCATAMLTLASLEDRAQTAFGRPVSFPQLLGLATAGDPTATLITNASGYGLGTVLAAISNLTLVPRIVLGGEASELARVAQEAMLAGLHAHRDARTADPEIHFQQPDLALWAQGAAVVAMHNTILGR